jgi:hypothetical protein
MELTVTPLALNLFLFLGGRLERIGGVSCNISEKCRSKDVLRWFCS